MLQDTHLKDFIRGKEISVWAQIWVITLRQKIFISTPIINWYNYVVYMRPLN